MKQDVIDALKTIGFTNGEAKAYFALLTLGPTTIGPLIEKSGVSASKAYNIVDKLVAKGLGSVSIVEGKKTFSPTTPKRILEYLDEQEETIKKNKERVKKIIPLLELKKETAQKKPVIETAKGKGGFESLFEEALEKTLNGEEYLAIAGRRISFKLQNYWFEQSKKISEKNISQYLAYEHDTWYKKDPKIHQRHKRKQFYPKILGKKYSNLPNIMVLGDKTLVTDTEDDEVFTLIIRNKNLTAAMKKLLWIVYDSGKTPKEIPK